MDPARQFLREFHNALPEGPLAPGDQRYWPIYENRQLTHWDPVDPLARNIDFADQPHLQFLAGSAGCGKSTELLRLQRRLEEDGHRVFLVDLASPVKALIGVIREKLQPQDSGKSVLLIDPVSRQRTEDFLYNQSDRDTLQALGLYIVLAVDPLTGTDLWLHRYCHTRPEWVEPLATEGSNFGPAFKAWQAYLASLGDWHRLVDEDGLRSILRTSGGSLGILFRLLRQITIRVGPLPVNSETLEQVMADEKEDLASLNEGEQEALVAVAQGRELVDFIEGEFDLDKGPTEVEEMKAESRRTVVSRLLASGAILYRRDSGFYVHPLLQPSVEKPLGSLSLSVGNPRTPDEHQTQDAVHLRRIDIAQLRVFEELRIDLRTPSVDQEGQWLLLLGDNGVGKTTVLRALVLALGQRPTGDTLLQLLGPSAPFLRHGAGEGRIEIHLDGGVYLARLTRDRRGVERLSSNGRPELGFPLYAYGCQRGTALGGPDRDVDFNPLDEVRTLFDPSAHLIHAEAWLTRLQLAARESIGGEDEAFFESVLNTLTGSLYGVDRIEVSKSGAWLFGPGVERAPLSALSDGYISTTGWILDLVARWADRHRQLGAVPDGDFRAQMNGLVLIDEIDLHLHPLWQVDVVSDLRTLFPRMSFVATTHNPLTLLGARQGEIVVLQRQGEGQIRALRRDIEPGTRADQVLTGEWFGLSSTVDRDTLEKIDLHRQLIRQGVPREDPKRQELEKELRHRLGSFEDTAIDRMVQSIAAVLMPASSRKLSEEERKSLRRQILEEARGRLDDGRQGPS